MKMVSQVQSIKTLHGLPNNEKTLVRPLWSRLRLSEIGHLARL